MWKRILQVETESYYTMEITPGDIILLHKKLQTCTLWLPMLHLCVRGTSSSLLWWKKKNPFLIFPGCSQFRLHCPEKEGETLTGKGGLPSQTETSKPHVKKPCITGSPIIMGEEELGGKRRAGWLIMPTLTLAAKQKTTPWLSIKWPISSSLRRQEIQKSEKTAVLPLLPRASNLSRKQKTKRGRSNGGKQESRNRQTDGKEEEEEYTLSEGLTSRSK